MEQLQNLYRLQQVELQLLALQENLKRLPVLNVFAQTKEKAARAKAELDALQEKFTAQQKLVKKLEQSLQETETKKQDLQTELFDSKKTAREVQQLEKKANILRQNLLQQEEKLIASLEETEKLAKALEEARRKYQRLRHDLQLLQQKGNKEIRQLKARIKKLQAEKLQLEEGISTELKAEYRRLCPLFQNRPLALVKNGICSGCYVAIPASVTGRLLTQKRVYCENCGRLLVILPESGDG